METSNYQQAKKELKIFSKEVKQEFKGDKPAIRQGLNDKAHYLISERNLSKHQTMLLQSFTCKLHP